MMLSTIGQIDFIRYVN